jgi:diacylglycerol O-acyltransferase
MTAVVERRPLSAADSLMWRIEADPVLRSSVLVVGMLDREPKPARVRDAFRRAAATLPGFGDRLVPPPLGVGHPEWAPVDEVALDHHVRHVELRGGDLHDVLTLAEPDVTAPFDVERPPWSVTIVTGLDSGRAAFLLRFHHAITDGVGALRLADRLLDDTRRASARAKAPATATAGRAGAAPAARSPRPGDGVARPAGPALVARLAQAGGAAARTAGASLRDPAGAMARSARLGSSLWRYLRPATAGASPLLTGRGIDRALRTFEVPVADLRAAAAACGGTVNDVLLAAVGGALAAYHRRHGVDLATMHTSMPVNRRPADAPGGGNRFTLTRFALPIDEPDPLTRARIVGAIAHAGVAEPAMGVTDLLVAGLDLLPAATVARLFGELLRGNDVNVVDLRGLDRPAFLAGARVDRLWAFAPTAGTACSVTLLSHRGTGCVALAADRAAVADPDVLAECLADALDEVVASVRGPGAGPS